MAENEIILKKNNSIKSSTAYSVTLPKDAKDEKSKPVILTIYDLDKNAKASGNDGVSVSNPSIFKTPEGRKQVLEIMKKGFNGEGYSSQKSSSLPAVDAVPKDSIEENIQEHHLYSASSLMEVLNARVKIDDEKVAKEASTDINKAPEKTTEASKDAKPAVSQTVAPAAQPAQKTTLSTPAAQPAQQIKATIPVQQVYPNQYYAPAPPQPMYGAPFMYAPSPASVVESSVLAGGLFGGLFGGIMGGLFGGARGFSGGLMSGMMGGMMGGLLGGLGSFGGGFGGFGGGFGGGFEGGFGAPDATDMALNQIFSEHMASLSAQSYMMSAYSPATMTAGALMPYSYSPQPLNQRPAATFITTPTQTKIQAQTQTQTLTSTQTNAPAAVSQPQNSTATPVNTTTSANPPQQPSTTSSGVATADAGQPVSGTQTASVTAESVTAEANKELKVKALIPYRAKYNELVDKLGPDYITKLSDDASLYGKISLQLQICFSRISQLDNSGTNPNQAQIDDLNKQFSSLATYIGEYEKKYPKSNSTTPVTPDLVLLPVNPPPPEAAPVDTSNQPKIDLEPVPDAPIFPYSAQDVKAKIAELRALKKNYIKTNPEDTEEIKIFDQQLEQAYRLLDQKMGR